MHEGRAPKAKANIHCRLDSGADRKDRGVQLVLAQDIPQKHARRLNACGTSEQWLRRPCAERIGARPEERCKASLHGRYKAWGTMQGRTELIGCKA